MLSRGSEWRRWEPHIHTPGTVLNNQFKGGDPWTDYLIRLESLAPKIEAIAVTDYYVTDSYEEMRERKSQGQLPDVQLNLVINTDADQVIVAEAGPHPAGGLPPITYISGGLENFVIRKAVCDILEGGEEAFRERARRLRVRLER